MRRFILSSPKFEGTVELLYNDEGTIDKIDFTDAKLSHAARASMKKLAPVLVDELEQSFQETSITIVEGDYQVTFDMFWKAYEKKINKARCIILWARMSKLEQIKAYTGIKAYDKFLRLIKWRIKCDPETYLRDKYFENDYK